MTIGDGPIVAAVREAREKIAAECDYDLQKLGERLRKIEAQHAGRIRSPRGPRGEPSEAPTNPK